MASKVETICNENIVPKINELGYEVIEVDYSKKVDGMNLTFTLYNEKGIKLEDCEKVHKLASKMLDELDPTGEDAYILNVESEGLDRPIKNRQDFLRHKGEEYEIKLYAKIDGKKVFKGKLVEYDESVVLENDGKTQSFPLESVAHIKPIIKF